MVSVQLYLLPLIVSKLAVGILSLPGTQHHFIGTMLQTLLECRKVLKPQGSGVCLTQEQVVLPYSSARLHLCCEAMGTDAFYRLTNTPDPREGKGSFLHDIRTISTKRYDVWDPGICFKRVGRYVGKGINIQGLGIDGLSTNIEAEFWADEALFELVCICLQFED